MTKDKMLLKKQLEKYYSFIFEKNLIQEIIAVGTSQSIKKGELFIDYGDELTHIPLITSGALRIILQDEKGNETPMYYLEKGETCAISFINCINRQHSIFKGVAEKDTEGVFVPVEKLDDWLVKYKSWRHYIIDSYHFRLIKLVKSVERLTFNNLEDRLVQYLIDKSEIMRSKILKITHLEISDDLGTARPVISRLLKDLEKEGKIKLKRGVIVISNIQILQNYTV